MKKNKKEFHAVDFMRQARRELTEEYLKEQREILC